LAATAIFGRRSSQPSLSTRTSTPVSWMNFWVFSRNSVSSPWTNLAGRSTRSVAPCSISKFGAGMSFATTCARGARGPSNAAPAIAPAPSWMLRRRVNLFIPALPD
jgi:hypothetical protein